MPHMNGTGPEGKGKQTGRNLGACHRDTAGEETSYHLGTGMGMRRKSGNGTGKGKRLKSAGNLY
ncbi:DUF5320 family protein [Microbacter margulisiae]|uniref:Uncharacterized protein n=1 Tax=Microbacter margulisiae TaxID=1350067 RepID=A0A7W5DRW9_9PORP|nr:DUF5320 family protein [Microbacter margulisiae]MBB3187613.1 hypothetical protein [Microbacter margulisiae]